jgi:acyl carrier protein
MTEPTDDLRTTVVQVLCAVAPDIDPADVGDDDDLQTALGLDSMDMLDFAAGLHEVTGVDVPDSDRAVLATVSSVVAYLRTRAAD